ncbi:MAG: 16S rRNA (cytidine(1402)-2'-O)-methyltransferase [Desulfobacteraceae bacterium]|nr:16S rRNA (cytidine(1402)-2'-O)-methyltransferase [Desulfobacteraceae bacterium]
MKENLKSNIEPKIDSGKGALYVVATPIGNLEDITHRAVRILKQVDLIAAEDTRHTLKLLNHFDIENKYISCNEQNEEKRAEEFITKLNQGLNIALVSDAGTPSVSDPGFKIVRRIIKEHIDVIPIPGCSAAIAGLSVAGLPTDSFLFKGFLPKKKGKRKTIISELASEKPTLIFYESPRRIIVLIEEIFGIMGNRPAMLAREITKLHEEYIRGDLELILEKLKAKDQVKGECTLYIQGSDTEIKIDDNELDKEIKLALSMTHQSELGTSDIAKNIAARFSLPRKKVYDRVVKFKNML